MLAKLCNKSECNTVIPQGQKYCSRHFDDRHKLYDLNVRDQKSAEFYHSLAWVKTRELILARYNYLDIYDLYVNRKFTIATTIHHIEELRDAWEKRLDLDNLIPLSDANHNRIHRLYERDQTETQRLLKKFISNWINEYKG